MKNITQYHHIDRHMVHTDQLLQGGHTGDVANPTWI